MSPGIGKAKAKATAELSKLASRLLFDFIEPHFFAYYSRSQDTFAVAVAVLSCSPLALLGVVI